MNIPLSHWIVFVGACAFVGWLNGRRARVQTPATPPPDTPAPSVPLLPDDTWCRCCGRRAPTGAMWCWDCLDHVDAEASTPMSATWYAQHGTLCPFLDLPAGSWVRPESRDVVPEGLGVTPAPRPSRISESCKWAEGERALFDEIRQRVAR